MISICEYCAYKTSDCEGDKDIEKVACQYFKKPLAVNFKKMAEDLAVVETKLSDLVAENSKLRCQIAGLKQGIICCDDDCDTCTNRCKPWQNGYNYNEHFRKKYEDMAEENSRLKRLKGLVDEGGLHNIVQVVHLNEWGSKRYTFNVPGDAELKKGDSVLCETKHGNPSVARCVTDSMLVSDKILDAIMSGEKVISKVIGKYELKEFF